MSAYNLFTCEANNCILMIKYDKNISNQWIIGDIFLKKYFTYFDYSTSTITVLSKTKLKVISKSNIIIISLLHIINIQCIIIVIILVITNFNYTK